MGLRRPCALLGLFKGLFRSISRLKIDLSEQGAAGVHQQEKRADALEECAAAHLRAVA